MNTILKCALPIPKQGLFDYLPPKGACLEQLRPGIRLQLPFGPRALTGILVELSGSSELNPAQLKPAARILDQEPLFSPTLFNCLVWAANYYQHPLGEVIQAALPKHLREGAALKVTETGYQATPAGMRVNREALARSPKQQQALLLLQEHPQGLSQKTLQSLNISAPVLKALVAKTWAQPMEIPRFKAAELSPGQILKEAPLTLSSEQQQAFEAIQQSFGGFECFLLDGVTGSGKTEIYLQLITALLSRQKQTLVLIPEISLTPQTLKRFSKRFNLPIALYHSGLTETEKRDTWLQARSGHARIIIGTRSAVFLPLKQPGLIIIDEEHDSSFKQQDGFRYSARDLAIYRARQDNIPIVLGTATPSLETWRNGLAGRFRHLEIKTRAAGASMARYKLVDIRNQPLTEGISQTLMQAIGDALQAGNQALIFLNRRGYSPVLICHGCGHTFPCPYCDAKLTVHKKSQLLCCHHCGFSTPLLSTCTQCESQKLHCLGQGTERLELCLKEAFPDFPVFRIDRDTIGKKSVLEHYFKAVSQGEPLILVGTQMLSKGHHFPHVTLAAIIDADAGLMSLDFRGAEKLAQLIVQVAGRAGRSHKPGEVWLQTRQPDHPLIQTLLHQGYHAFANQMLSERKSSGLPPYAYLALLRAESAALEPTMEFLAACVAKARAMALPVAILGPAAAPMERRAGQMCAQVLLQSDKRSSLHQMLNNLVPLMVKDPLSRKVRWSLDVDPVELY